MSCKCKKVQAPASGNILIFRRSARMSPDHGWNLEKKHLCKHFDFLLKIDNHNHEPNVHEVNAQVKSINAAQIS